MCVRVQFTRGTVQSQHFYFDRNNFFLLQRIKNTLYYAIFTPSFKSLVNAIPFAVFLWKCPPLAPIFGNIQDSVDKCVIVDFYIPTLNRKILFDSCVLRFCDIHVFIISYFDLSVNMLYFDVLISGNFNALNSDDEKTLRQSSLQRGLSEKIRELVSIKEFASAKKAELSRDIKKLRLEKEELEDRLCEEDDDDLANDIDRQISANEEIIKTKSASFHSYSVCETRLESLYNYAKEACDAGEDQVRKVNAYLDMEKIRAVTSDPSSLDTVWQRINSEIELLEGKVRKSDENRARQNMGNSSTISSSAAKRREELRNRKRQKEENAKNMETIDHILDGKDTTVTQEVK